jgi:hypothetical protein
MNEKIDRDFQRKAYFDLWLHQNILFWGRFQLLYIIQGAFFVVAWTMKAEPALVHYALAITLIFMIWLYSTLDQDRRLRNWHAHILKIRFGFDPLPPKITTWKSIPPVFWEISFQLSVFLIFVTADILFTDHLAPFCGGNFGFTTFGKCIVIFWRQHSW